MFFGKLFGKKGENDDAPTSSLRDCISLPSTCNIVLIGSPSLCKTGFLEVFCDGKPSGKGALTEFRRKEFKMFKDSTTILNIWNLIGEECLVAADSPYWNGAHGMLLCYDASEEDTFEHTKSFVEKNIRVISRLKIPTCIVGILQEEKKEEKKRSPDSLQDESKVLADKIGANASKCCLKNEESVSKIFRKIVVDISKKYSREFCSDKGSDALPPKPSNPPPRPPPSERPPGSMEPKEPKEDETAPKESFPASLIPLCDHEENKQGVKRNENGLFGEYLGGVNPLTYKISVLGNPKAGKSCLCARYLNRKSGSDEAKMWTRSFSLPYLKYLVLRANEGEFPKSDSDDAANYTKAHAVLLCYDITDRASFDALKGAMKEVKEHTIPGAVLMVVGLRYDEKDCVDVSGSEGKAFADENGVLFRECSAAADGLGVSGVFTKVLLELQRIDGFALPIREEEANSTLPLSVNPVDGKKDRRGEVGSTESLLEKILSERGYKKENFGLHDEYDSIFRIRIFGSPGAGKSSLLLRYVDDTWIDSSISAIDVDFKIKTICPPSGYSAKIQIWDMPGQEKIRYHGKGYEFRNSEAIIVCYDPTDLESFDELGRLLYDANFYARENTFIVLVGTKSDLPPVVDIVAARKLADSFNTPLMTCSAKTGAGLDELFLKITETVLARMPPYKTRD